MVLIRIFFFPHSFHTLCFAHIYNIINHCFYWTLSSQFKINLFRLKNIEYKIDELKTIESSILTQDSRRHSLPSILSVMRYFIIIEKNKGFVIHSSKKFIMKLCKLEVFTESSSSGRSFRIISVSLVQHWIKPYKNIFDIN